MDTIDSTVPEVQELADNIARCLAREIYNSIYAEVSEPYYQRMQSKIEVLFAAVMRLGARYNGLLMFDAMPSKPLASTDLFFLEPQVKIGPYTADFVLGCVRFPQLENCVIVECDGHDFHEKTKQQAAHDKKRDRYLNSKVAKVLRFTGSEIYRDAQQCGIEALEMLTARVREQLR